MAGSGERPTRTEGSSGRGASRLEARTSISPAHAPVRVRVRDRWTPSSVVSADGPSRGTQTRREAVGGSSNAAWSEDSRGVTGSTASVFHRPEGSPLHSQCVSISVQRRPAGCQVSYFHTRIQCLRTRAVWRGAVAGEPDPVCHQSCGPCGTGEQCNLDTGTCECSAQCSGLECGPDRQCGIVHA